MRGNSDRSHQAHDSLLEIADLMIEFGSGAESIFAVRGVDLRIDRGQVVGLVGESGSGKSVTVLSVLRLLADAKVSGDVIVDGQDVYAMSDLAVRRFRRSVVGIVFQNPMSSFDPTMRIGKQLIEGLGLVESGDRSERRSRAIQLLTDVGISDPEKRMSQYPHHFSGGMRQRVALASALIAEPSLLIADEPTTALDVTIEAQILDLLSGLSATRDMAILIITHDLAVVAGMADWVYVMYAGKIVESGPTADVLRGPKHPYTRGLIASIPDLHRDVSQRLRGIAGAPPDPRDTPDGCAFAPRCGPSDGDLLGGDTTSVQREF